MRRKKMFHPTLLSHTRGNDSFSQSARGLCANLQDHFVTGGLVIFLSAATVPVQFAAYSGATEDRRHETRQTRERGSLLKSFRRALRKYQMITVMSFLPLRFARRSLSRIDIISTITLRLVRIVIFRGLIAKAEKCDKEDPMVEARCDKVSLECKCKCSH